MSINVNIYESKKESVTNNNEELISLLKEIQKENNELKEFIKSSFKDFDKRLKEMEKQVIDVRNPTPAEAKSTLINALKGLDKKDTKKKSKKIVTNKQDKELYSRPIFDKNKLVYFHRVNNRKFISKFTINDVLYIREKLESDKLTLTIKNQLKRRIGFTKIQFDRLIYNIKFNPELKKQMDDYNKKIKDLKFNFVGYKCVIDGDITEITEDQAREWAFTAVNSNDGVEELIYKLSKRFPHIKKEHIRCIILNQDTISISNSEKEVFVENNPSRRRNLIRNGGTV